MDEILKFVSLKDLIVLGIMIVSFTEFTKTLLPAKIKNEAIMAIGLIYGIIFSIGMYYVGIIETIQTAIISGILTAGVVSGSIGLVFDLIRKKKNIIEVSNLAEKK